MKKINIVFICLITLSGCATSSLNYSPPSTSYTIKHSVQINEDFEVVWDRLVKNLASDFFVINNIEKNSRIINVSFSASKPTDFVDCGITTREFSNASGKYTYSYDPADPTKYSFANKQGHMFNAVRTSKLNGRTNIYLAPSETGTLLTVNTKYVVDVKIKYFNVNNQSAGNDEFVFDFSTKRKYEDGEMVCTARGNLEDKILGYAK
ncbi:hypothetical protein HOB87_13200 [Candidatus Woesearchaeota archaeon]|jgi:uncharacterized protein YceK|nr:hypothetical protein [Candidatus Woesearchaeota archaeon]MBT6217884.1 hypothetical protein [Candidatus Neomarinimicrobiota bacterium]MBT7139978.1 hypothetical protein [Gammaproteobacteria bacterium]